MIEVIVDNTYRKTSPMRSFKRFKKDECEHTPSIIRGYLHGKLRNIPQN